MKINELAIEDGATFSCFREVGRTLPPSRLGPPATLCVALRAGIAPLRRDDGRVSRSSDGSAGTPRPTCHATSKLLCAKGIISLTLLCLLPLILVACSREVKHAAVDATINYLANGGFEELDGKGMPIRWFRAWRPELATNLIMEIDRTCAHSGTNSAKISCAGLKELVCNNWAQEINDFPKGVRLHLTGWTKTQDVQKDDVVICIQCWDKDDQMIGFGTTQKDYVFEGTRDWTQVHADVFVPKDTKTICVRLSLSGKGTVWFDDISLSPGKN